MTSLSPPPPTLIQDDPSAADLARKRFAPRARFLSLPSLRSPPSKPSLKPSTETTTLEIDSTNIDTPINLDNSALINDDYSKDLYQWAVIYENQRGMTLFSTPYYSKLSLLPTDPSPFTLPDNSYKRSEQPPVSFEEYPLPDGNWHWVSRCWMIDMRSDSGEVQHDGFEYNWMFRKHNWRAQVGFVSAGGWVRRRRWVRLMLRPGRKVIGCTDGISVPSSSSVKSGYLRQGQSTPSLFPPSVLTSITDVVDDWSEMDPSDVWIGDDPDANWQRCHKLMKKFGRDGRKLELWRLWFGFYHPEHKHKFLETDEKGKRRDKQWTEDEGPLPSEALASDALSRESVTIAPREAVIPVLRKYGQTLLHSFTYPESRVQFLKVLANADLLLELNATFGVDSTNIEFWSYASSLEVVAKSPVKDMAVADCSM